MTSSFEWVGWPVHAASFHSMWEFGMKKEMVFFYLNIEAWQ
jgi:hypothetical protein